MEIITGEALKAEEDVIESQERERRNLLKEEEKEEGMVKEEVRKRMTKRGEREKVQIFEEKEENI